MGLVISICSMNGNELRPWAEAGRACIAVDLQNDGRIEEFPSGGSILFLREDVFDLPDGFCERAEMAFGFPPCTDLAASGARWFARKGREAYREAKRLASRVMALISRAGAWALENPVGRLATGWRAEPGWRHGAASETFDPCDFGGWAGGGDRYTKRTCLWTGGNWRTPRRRPVEPTEGSKMHRLFGGSSTKTKNARSATPRGWARAVFAAHAG